MTPEKPDNTVFALKMWRFVGLAVLGVALWGVYDELGRRSSYNALVGDDIGGPNAQSIFLAVLLGTGGLLLSAWAHRALRQRPPE